MAALDGIPPDVMAAALVVAGSLVYPPLARRKLVFHRCPFRQITGIPCPTCGLTRSLALASRGRIIPAFRQHFLGPPLLIYLLWRVSVYLVNREDGRARGREATFSWKEEDRTVLACLVLVAWALRLLLFGRDKRQDEEFWKALKGQ
ncbi:MAG: DUF2752 domain-containing protein [Candidatus Geothermincolales bacterium]